MKSRANLIDWLLEGDLAIRYQCRRDLLGEDHSQLQARIASEGWGARFLAQRQANGHWGRGFYQPKWISSHYTLLDLKHLQITPDQPQARATIDLIARTNKAEDGGIHPIGTVRQSDACINGMFLNYACYFGIAEKHLHSVADFLLGAQLPDGGFNCHFNRKGARHSSLHSSISILEGIQEYARNGYRYRLPELEKAAAAAREFILRHRLYKSDRTGKIIKKSFTMLSYPSRWYYDILRALVYFTNAQIAYDARMADALDLLISKRRPDGAWPVQAKHAGAVHFDMEATGQPSRWNTLRAQRVLARYT